MADALAELEKWCRKYYRFTIQSGGSIMPGDGVTVELNAGGRRVLVDEFHVPDDATISDVILEAIRLWHADDSTKNYHVFWSAPDNSEILPPADMKVQKWGNFGPVLMAELTAQNEDAARQRIRDLYQTAPPDFSITVYEKHRPKPEEGSKCSP